MNSATLHSVCVHSFVYVGPTYTLSGGSTVVILFEKGVVEWDEDLSINSRACLETLVRVGMGIGRRRRGPAEPSK